MLNQRLCKTTGNRKQLATAPFLCIREESTQCSRGIWEGEENEGCQFCAIKVGRGDSIAVISADVCAPMQSMFVDLGH